jgi:GT2 family glycosyltransferase
MSFTNHPFHFTIVDNMSSFSTKNYLKRLQKNHPIHVIPYNNEFNYSAELNSGFNYSFTFPQIKYGLAIHSDAVVEPNWLSKLLHVLARDKSNGCVGVESNHYLLFKREVFHKLSGFDEKYGGHGYVIRDFTMRAEREGWKFLSDPETDIHHFSQTQMREGLVTTNHYEEDKKLFFSKFKQEALT